MRMNYDPRYTSVLPPLALHEGSVAQINLGGLTRLAEAQTVLVQGNATVLGISEGGLREQPGYLTIQLAPHATLTNTGQLFVFNGSTFNEDGGAHSSFVNNGSVTTWGVTTFKFGTDVAGTGTITDGHAPAYLQGSKIEFGGAVGAGQKIMLDSGTLQLDKPMQFHAVIEQLNAKAPPGTPSPERWQGNGMIVLEHTKADSAFLSNTELVLKHAGAIVADLHFAGLAKDGVSQLYLASEKDGSLAFSSYALPNSQAVHVGATPTLLS
jgi:hypothetical protein